ncbi:MAG: ketopantoate reductase family protein [Alphaproteobacteria bacterium]|nr:ketopantoate reductase family protein [Alphaproteobacteria bacterium]
MRIAVIGAGSMGSVLGGKLARAGTDVTLYDSNRNHIDAIRDRGLTVTDPDGSFTLPIVATTDISMIADADVALVLVDSNATAVVAPLLRAVLKSDGAALTLQNGIGNVEVLADALGDHRVLAGATFISAAMIGPGHAHNTNIGDTVLGESVGGPSDRASSLAALLRLAGLPATASGNAMGHVWSKFALNCALNPLSALTRLRPGEVIRHAAMARLLDDLIAEILAVVSAKRITLPETDPAKHIRDHAWLRYNRPSMLQHLGARRPTEIGSLNEALVREADRLGVPVPANRTIAALVRGLEARNARGDQVDEKLLEADAEAEFIRAVAKPSPQPENGGTR